MRAGFSALVAILALGACHKAAPLPPRTFHYFETHDAERAAALARCQTEDRAYQDQDECGNALRAQRGVNIAKDAGQTIR